MSKTLQLNMYLKRNNRACMVFKTGGMLYRINNLNFAKEFVSSMKELGKTVAGRSMEDFYVELYDHRKKCWVLECAMLEGIVSMKLWFQSESSGEHLDVRFKWEGIVTEFVRAVHGMVCMVGVSTLFKIYRK